jgi:hypothetical protein
MMKTKEAQTKQKRIEDLTRRELDMVYSLVRIGEWADSEIGRVYKLTVDDVHKIFDNYPHLCSTLGPESREQQPSSRARFAEREEVPRPGKQFVHRGRSSVNV